MARAARTQAEIEAGKRYADLRIKLGQSLKDVVDRALTDPHVRRAFNPGAVSKFEGDGTGGGSDLTMRALSVGVGLSRDDLWRYLHEGASVEWAIGVSTVEVDVEKARRLADLARRESERTQRAGVGDERLRAAEQRIRELEEELTNLRGLHEDLKRGSGAHVAAKRAPNMRESTRGVAAHKSRR